MITIAFTFHANRYHATPWGRHVNEGEVEWPPSPWRFLRALIAVWKRRFPDLEEEQVTSLLRALQHPPRFFLPAASIGHTRHYMPQRGEETLLVHDNFVVLSSTEQLQMQWDRTLPEEQLQLLERLLGGLQYLGRAESWCDARLSHSPEEPNCLLVTEEGLRSDEEVVEVLGAATSASLGQLCVETSELFKAGWSRPPGSIWLRYRRKRSCLTPNRVARSVSPRSGSVARYLIDAKVLPKRTETLRAAESVRSMLMGIFGRQNERSASRTFSGKDADGKFLRNHGHAYILPDSSEDSRRLDSLTIALRSSDGKERCFGDEEQRALRALSNLWRRREIEDGRRISAPLVFIAFGQPSDFRAGSLTGQLGRSRVWRSTTPFCLGRHPKKRGGKWVDLPEDQLRRIIAEHDWLPEPDCIEALKTCETSTSKAIDWFEFARVRRHRPQFAHPYGFEIRFPEPVEGPLALGCGCHFGLGQFRAVEEKAALIR